MKSNQTKPSKKAVVLEYQGENVPFVATSGEGMVANSLLTLAEQIDLPVVKDTQLTKHLDQLNFGENIPQELYVSITQVIALVYFLEGNTNHTPDNTG